MLRLLVRITVVFAIFHPRTHVPPFLLRNDSWRIHRLTFPFETLGEAQRKRADKEKEGLKKRSHIDFTAGSGSSAGVHGLQQQLYGASASTSRSGSSSRTRTGQKPTRWGPV